MTATDYVQAFDTGKRAGAKDAERVRWIDYLEAMIDVSVACKREPYTTQYTAGYVTGLCDRLRELDKR